MFPSPEVDMVRQRRSDALQNAERLRQAATDVFTTTGIDTPLEDVARAAGVSIGTLYNHVGSRDALLEQILPAALELRAQQIRRAVTQGTDPADRLARYLTAVFAVQHEDRLLSDAFATQRIPTRASRACTDIIELGEQLLAAAGRAATTAQAPEPDHDAPPGRADRASASDDATGSDGDRAEPNDSDVARGEGIGLLPSPQALAGLVVANSTVQRAGAPDGWAEFLTGVTASIRRPR